MWDRIEKEKAMGGVGKTKTESEKWMGTKKQKGWGEKKENEKNRILVKVMTQNESSEGGRKGLDFLVESGAKLQKTQKRGQMINLQVKTIAECEMGKRGGEVVDWLIEFISNSEMEERGREIIDWAIEIVSEGKVA